MGCIFCQAGICIDSSHIALPDLSSEPKMVPIFDINRKPTDALFSSRLKKPSQDFGDNMRSLPIMQYLPQSVFNANIGYFGAISGTQRQFPMDPMDTIYRRICDYYHFSSTGYHTSTKYYKNGQYNYDRSTERDLITERRAKYYVGAARERFGKTSALSDLILMSLRVVTEKGKELEPQLMNDRQLATWLLNCRRERYGNCNLQAFEVALMCTG
jgi:hypothetical protein